MSRFRPLLPTLLPALLLALTAPALALGATAGPKERIKKNPSSQTQQARPQKAQTAPAGKEKKPPTPEEAGILEVKGTVIKVFPERHALIVRTTTNDYQVFAISKTVLTRDGKPVKLEEIHPGDRVDSCRFNAKRVMQKLNLLSPPPGTIANPQHHR